MNWLVHEVPVYSANTPFAFVSRIAEVSDGIASTSIVEEAELKYPKVDEALAITPPVLKMCNPVHVGTMDCESAGAPSERRKVVAEPLVAVRPIVAVGFAADVVEHVGHVIIAPLAPMIDGLLETEIGEVAVSEEVATFANVLSEEK